jgi:hypothetical protein
MFERNKTPMFTILKNGKHKKVKTDLFISNEKRSQGSQSKKMLLPYLDLLLQSLANEGVGSQKHRIKSNNTPRK